MAKITENRLLLTLLAIPLVSWGPGLYVPGEWVTKFASFTIVLFGVMALWQRRQSFYEVVWLQRRDEQEQGSHYGIVGDVLIAAGLIYSGVYGYWWVWADQPDGWSATMYSSFGRILMGFGLGFNFLMVQASGPRGKAIEGNGWLVVAIIAAFIAGMIVMGQMRFSGDPMTIVYPVAQPSCSQQRPIWGSSTGRYHMPSSPYRPMIRPVACFASTTEAEAAGFKAAKY